jgi:hypothetical protein
MTDMMQIHPPTSHNEVAEMFEHGEALFALEVVNSALQETPYEARAFIHPDEAEVYGREKEGLEWILGTDADGAYRQTMIQPVDGDWEVGDEPTTVVIGPLNIRTPNADDDEEGFAVATYATGNESLPEGEHVAIFVRNGSTGTFQLPAVFVNYGS